METLMHLTSSNGKKLMLRITTQKKRGKTLLSIEGRLAGPLVGTLEQRSEEHTSELQSHSDLVCRLLLEKKKKKTTTTSKVVSITRADFVVGSSSASTTL